MKYLWGIAFGVVVGFLGVGLLLLTTGKPRGEPILLSPPPTSAPLIIHITGAVNKPGVYALPPASRVGEAIDIAGGLADNADASLINLAKIVEDGAQIWVPYMVRASATQVDLEIVIGEPTSSKTSNQININTATQSELESLSGIGPVYAQAIIKYRLENGPFEKIEDIQEVSGIGPVTFEKIRPYITVRGGSGN
jgi:competence protein ComEA